MSRLPVDAFVAGADGAAEFRGSVVYHFYPGTSYPLLILRSGDLSAGVAAPPA